VLGLASPVIVDVKGTLLGFEQHFALEDANGSDACSFEASKRVSNHITLGLSLSYRLPL
jgi:hypothetical protein